MSIAHQTARDIQPCTDRYCEVHGYRVLEFDPKRAAELCARQIMRAHGRGDAIDLLEFRPGIGLGVDGSRAVLPFSSTIPAGGTVTIPLQLGAGDKGQDDNPALTFQPETVFLSQNVDLSTIAVHDITIAGVSQFRGHTGLPARLFATNVRGARIAYDVARAADPAEPIAITVQNLGSEEVTLFGSMIGGATYEKASLGFELEIEPGKTSEITIQAGLPMKPTELVLANADARIVGAGDGTKLSDDDPLITMTAILVTKLAVNGRSQFVGGKGSIPGDLFATTFARTFMRLDPITPGAMVEIAIENVDTRPIRVRGALRGNR